MSSAALLTQAVTSGDAKAVSAALANGADVDERNNGGQTALILAVIFGHTHLVQLLVNAGANPRLRDNLGLDAIEWAQRRGLTEAIEIFGGNSVPAQPIRQIRVEEDFLPTETRIDTDEKSRKWLAGVKQRIQEQARKEVQIVEPVPAVEAAPAPEPEPIPLFEPTPPLLREPIPLLEPDPPQLHEAAPKTSSARKRCPRCNTIYNSELLAYCAHHVVPLVDADEPIFEPPRSNSSNTPLLWIFILVTVSIGAFTGYMIVTQLSNSAIPDTPIATTQQQPQGFLKGTPVAAGELAGKSVQLPQAECPVFENQPRPANTAYTVNVHVKIDKTGKVYWARAEGGDEPLRRAASEAASNSTFSPDRLRGRETEGTITYTFAP